MPQGGGCGHCEEYSADESTATSTKDVPSVFSLQSRFTYWWQFVLPPLDCAALRDTTFTTGHVRLIVHGMTARWHT